MSETTSKKKKKTKKKKKKRDDKATDKVKKTYTFYHKDGKMIVEAESPDDARKKFRRQLEKKQG